MTRSLILASLLCVALPGSLVSAQTAPVALQKVESNLLQLMRGMLFPASNVVFAAQRDLSRFRADQEPAISPNLLTSLFGGWEAVENASLVLAESANLLLVPGRACANGNVPPIERRDWIQFTQALRDAGQAAYKAARTRNQDAMIEVSGTVAASCSACHGVYRRDRQNDTRNRCVPLQ